MTYTDTLTSIHKNSKNEGDKKAYSSIAKRCFALIATKVFFSIQTESIRYICQILSRNSQPHVKQINQRKSH